jgi:hypothetical protein
MEFFHDLGACGVFSRSARNVEEMRLHIGIGAISVVVVKAFSVLGALFFEPLRYVPLPMASGALWNTLARSGGRLSLWHNQAWCSMDLGGAAWRCSSIFFKTFHHAMIQIDFLIKWYCSTYVHLRPQNAIPHRIESVDLEAV